MGRPPVFDSYVMVDWSAAARPRTGRDSIWVAVLDRHGTAIEHSEPSETHNPATRAAATDLLVSLLVARTGRRVLVGFDVALGYPAGFARRLGLSTDDAAPPWKAVWQAIDERLVDGADNANNRFAVAAELNRLATGRRDAGPFWGAPRTASPAPSPRKSPFPSPGDERTAGLAEFRATESALRAGGARPMSVWQLLGAGSVGSQTLTAIPVIRRLGRHPDLTRRVRVWPFDTGLVADPTAGTADAVVVAEIWPGAIAVDEGRHPVRDAAQMLSSTAAFAAADTSGRLHEMFAPDLGDAVAASVVAEEGWVLGAPPAGNGGARPTP